MEILVVLLTIVAVIIVLWWTDALSTIEDVNSMARKGVKEMKKDQSVRHMKSAVKRKKDLTPEAMAEAIESEELIKQWEEMQEK